jgi:hypothetical protein
MKISSFARFLWLPALMAAPFFLMAQAPGSLLGTWQAKEGPITIVLTLNADGTGKLDEASIKYTVKGAALVVEEAGVVNKYAFQLEGNRMTLSGGDLEKPMLFERQGSAPLSGLAARRAQAPKAEEKAQTELKGKTEDKELAGQWQGPEGIIQIKTDGTVIVGGVPYRYTAQNNIINLVGAEGMAQIPYQLNGDTLLVQIGGQTVNLKRLSEGSGALPGGGGNTAEAAGGGSGTELVGKWCYFSSFNSVSGGGSMTEECFTLAPNGTYQYHREGSISAYSTGIYGATASQTDDSGTWRVSGNMVTVVSRTSGTSTYTITKRNNPKNGDPMICLDGRCFVTYYQRPSWR